MRIALFFAALGLTAAPALAKPLYLFVDERGDASYAVFIDLNSIKKSGPRVEYWMLQVNLAATATKSHFLSHALRRYTEDCQAHTSQLTYAVLYTASGEPLSQGPVSVAANPVVPETVGDEIEDLLCRGQPPSYATVNSIDEARLLGRRLMSKIKKR